MFLLTTIFIMILIGAEVDLFVPSFPELQKIFALSPFKVEMLFTSNLMAHCLAAFLAGSLGDKYGRRLMIIIGLFIFITGSFICVCANSYFVLIIGRIIQGVGISAPSVLICALMSDLYSTKRMQHLLGLVNGAVTVAMAFAPVVGSYVNLFFNWRGNFLVLLIMGCLSLLLVLKYAPKTEKIHLKPYISLSIKEYLPIFRSQKAVLYLIFLCFAMQSYWIFIGMSPILYMNDLNVKLEDFGLYQGAIAATFAVTSLVSNFFLERFGTKKCFIFSACMLSIFIFLVAILVIFNIKHPGYITGAMLFQAVGMVYPINIFWPLALDSVENAKGKMGALLASGKWTLSAIAISITGFFYNGSFVAIGIGICITFIISAVAGFLLFYNHKVLD